MRCCICASDCRAFTTNLRKHEGLNMRPRLKRLVFIAPLAILDVAVYRHRRRSSDAALELAAAAALRLAPDHLLASGWDAGAVPYPLRWIWISRFRSLQLSPS